MRIKGIFRETVLGLDQFGQGFHFQLPGNKATYNTWIGAFFSTIMIFVLVFYSMTMLEQLLLFGGTVVTESVRESHFEPYTLFPTEIPNLHKGHFNIAFGFTAYDGDPNPIDDPRYGQLKVRRAGWGGAGNWWKELAAHPCTESELGLEEGDDTLFYPIHRDSQTDLKVYGKKLMCFDEQIKIHGDYNAVEAQIINVYYERCNNKTISPQNTCHSHEQITEYLRRKFIIIVQNEERFQAHKYDSEKIIQEAKFKWFAVNSQIRQDVVNKVRVTKLELQDKRPLQLGPLTQEEGSIFRIDYHQNRPYEFFDDVHMLVSYEFDMNMHVINRSTYTLLNWLGDVGGFGEGLAIIFGFTIALFNYNTFEDHLVRQLYRKETQKDRISREGSKASALKAIELQKAEGEKLPKHKTFCLVRRLRDFGLRRCCWKKFKKSRNDLYYEKGRSLLGDELDIVRVLQQLRLFEKLTALKLPLSYDEKQYVENNRFKKLHLSDKSYSEESEDDFQENELVQQHERDASDLFSKSKRLNVNEISIGQLNKQVKLVKQASILKNPISTQQTFPLFSDSEKPPVFQLRKKRANQNGRRMTEYDVSTLYSLQPDKHNAKLAESAEIMYKPANNNQ